MGYSPTVLIINGASVNGTHYFFKTQNPLDDPKLNRFIPKDVLANTFRRWGGGGHKSEHNFDQLAETATKIFRATGKVGTGSHGFDGNTNIAGLGVHWEMQALVMGGATAHEAMQMATIGGAKVIGRATELGSLEPGKYADLVIFDKNPLENIRNTESINMVMKNGRLYNGDDLKEVWPEDNE
jgi:hypothetical protein